MKAFKKVYKRGKVYVAFPLPQGELLLPLIKETRAGYVVYNPALGGEVVLPKINQ